MLKKFLKESMMIIAGKQAEELVDVLDTNKYINEFVIAKKLNLTINQTRNVLYKISDHGLVSSIRKKDKRKGWYTYFWKVESLRSLEFLKDDLSKKIENFTHQIKSRETKRFYVCDRCHLELNEEHALLNNFTCTECGQVLMLKDNNKLVGEMKKNLEKLKREMALVDEEIAKENEISGKKRAKEMKKEQEEKAMIALKKRQKKAREKKSAKKVSSNKKPKPVKKS